VRESQGSKRQPSTPLSSRPNSQGSASPNHTSPSFYGVCQDGDLINNYFQMTNPKGVVIRAPRLDAVRTAHLQHKVAVMCGGNVFGNAVCKYQSTFSQVAFWCFESNTNIQVNVQPSPSYPDHYFPVNFTPSDFACTSDGQVCAATGGDGTMVQIVQGSTFVFAPLAWSATKLNINGTAPHDCPGGSTALWSFDLCSVAVY